MPTVIEVIGVILVLAIIGGCAMFLWARDAVEGFDTCPYCGVRDDFSHECPYG